MENLKLRFFRFFIYLFIISEVVNKEDGIETEKAQLKTALVLMYTWSGHQCYNPFRYEKLNNGSRMKNRHWLQTKRNSQWWEESSDSWKYERLHAVDQWLEIKGFVSILMTRGCSTRYLPWCENLKILNRIPANPTTYREDTGRNMDIGTRLSGQYEDTKLWTILY